MSLARPRDRSLATPTTPAPLSSTAANWLNGWAKDGERGKFLSLSARPVEEPAAFTER